jgi:tRNA(fMet)-specific endonuclease VapC
MNGSYLLDTNIVIDLLGRNEATETQLAEASTVYIPSIVLGELYYGSYKSTRVESNLAKLERFAAKSAVLNCDNDTARYYGQIKNELRRKGKPIPENDIWIAAISMQYGINLVTRDAHFAEIAGLSLESW